MKKFYDMQVTEGSYGNSSNKLQTVYIPTKVEDEPIPESMGVFTLSRNSSIPSLLRTWNQESKKSVNYEKEKSFTSKMFSHWLNPQEGYFYTEEQLKQLLQDYTDKIVDSVDITYGEGIDIDNVSVDKKTITNQLEPFLKDLL